MPEAPTGGPEIPVVFVLEDDDQIRYITKRILRGVDGDILAPNSFEELDEVFRTVRNDVKVALLDVNLTGWALDTSAPLLPIIRRVFPRAELALYTTEDPENLMKISEYDGIYIFGKHRGTNKAVRSFVERHLKRDQDIRQCLMGNTLDLLKALDEKEAYNVVQRYLQEGNASKLQSDLEELLVEVEDTELKALLRNAHQLAGFEPLFDNDHIDIRFPILNAKELWSEHCSYITIFGNNFEHSQGAIALIGRDEISLDDACLIEDAFYDLHAISWFNHDLPEIAIDCDENDEILRKHTDKLKPLLEANLPKEVRMTIEVLIMCLEKTLALRAYAPISSRSSSL